MSLIQINIYAIILNYNSSHDTMSLYSELVNCMYENLVVLVIDNNSADLNRKLLEENIPHDKLILNKRNLGYAAGNNIGIDIALKANADYIWILNPDIRVDKNALSILVETMQNDSTLAAVGPRILKRENPEIIFTDGEKLLMNKECHTHQKNHNKNRIEVEATLDYDIDYVDGSCILINSKAINDTGFLPEEYFLYFEETDWCSKAKQLGYNLAINSHSFVYNLTSKKKETFHYYFMRNRLIFSKKYHPAFNEVRKYYFHLLLKEFMNRFKGKYLNPFYKSRVKGLFAGIIKTL